MGHNQVDGVPHAVGYYDIRPDCGRDRHVRRVEADSIIGRLSSATVDPMLLKWNAVDCGHPELGSNRKKNVVRTTWGRDRDQGRGRSVCRQKQCGQSDRRPMEVV